MHKQGWTLAHISNPKHKHMCMFTDLQLQLRTTLFATHSNCDYSVKQKKQ
eukprot:m.40763 g.40763  ORF g.40763 m.40763 type:complete len:50 (-) comp10377_c0_seq8:90-239(-)